MQTTHCPFQIVSDPLRGACYRSVADAYSFDEQQASVPDDAEREKIPEPSIPSAGELREATVERLGEIRREFALKHHPDMVSASRRSAATESMATLNRMIDDELTRRRTA